MFDLFFSLNSSSSLQVWRKQLTMGYHPEVCDLINGARILGEVIPWPEKDVPQHRVDYCQNLLENMYPSWGYPDCMLPPKHIFASCNVMGRPP